MRLNLSARGRRHVNRSLLAASAAAAAFALGVPVASHASTTPSSKSSATAVSAIQQNQPAGVGTGHRIR